MHQVSAQARISRLNMSGKIMKFVNDMLCPNDSRANNDRARQTLDHEVRNDTVES